MSRPLLLSSFLFLFARSGALRSLPSFPTRRSSDLARIVPQRPRGQVPLPRTPRPHQRPRDGPRRDRGHARSVQPIRQAARSEEHTSELQSPCNLVCRLLLEKKKTTSHIYTPPTRTA